MSLTAEARTARYLSTSVVAQRLQLSERTVRVQLAAGKIPGSRVSPTSPWRVPATWLHDELTRIGAQIRRPPPKNHNG